jgi:hypothetical protein
MDSKLRKFFIWLISLGVVFAIYLLVTRLGDIPEIDIDTSDKSADVIGDSNIDQPGGDIGKISNVGVGTIQKARYVDLNEEKQIDREFGFEKLLRQRDKHWEIEKPFMNIYRNNFKCYITADTGTVQVETAGGKPSPKDATLTGNVVIHILPENDSDIKDSFIYLDDIVFISERSQFSTAGPVKFVSEDVQMLGKGLELIYNNVAERLEFLKIIHLESLRLRQQSNASLFPSQQADAAVPAETASRTQIQQPRQTSQADDSQRQDQYYKAVLRKNVVIDSPEQVIFSDEVSINNILLSKAPGENGKPKRPAGADKMKAPTDIAEESAAAEQDKSEQSESTDIVVSCDNGIVIVPMDSAHTLKDSSTTAAERKSPQNLDNIRGRTTFVAPKIDYCALTNNTIASGPSELTFYSDDIMRAESNSPVPVNITAQKETNFKPDLNLVTFEGDCLCTMTRQDPNFQQEYRLSAPKFTVNLAAGKSGTSFDAAGIEHLTADGGTVRLASVKTAVEGDEKFLGGIELKCSRFDADNRQQLFTAAGPGVIKVDNSNIPETEAGGDKFSLRRKCYALVSNFDTLKYFSQANKIIADAESQAIIIDYIPVVDDQYGQHVRTVASHIEAEFVETADGQTELSTFTATDGIHYEEKDVEFQGSELFYDANNYVMTVQGNESQPCLLNGAPVDAIEYDLKTGKISAELIAPGALQIRR